MAPELRPVLERGDGDLRGVFVAHDHHVGRVIEAIDELGVLENTLIYYHLGDNGASPEGTMNGTFNEWIAGNGFSEEIRRPSSLANLEKWAARRPTTNTRRGGRGDGLPVSVDQAGGLALGRDPQRHDRPLAAGDQPEGRGALAVLPCDRFRPYGAGGGGDSRALDGQRGPAEPYEGTSMLYTFDAPEEPERHELQYFEMVGNRGMLGAGAR